MATVLGYRIDYMLWAFGSASAVAAHLMFVGLFA